MSIESLIFRILPFLFSALRRAFEEKPYEQKAAIISGTAFAQVLKNESANGHQAILTSASSALGWFPDGTDDILKELIRRRGWECPASDHIGEYIQARLLLMPEESSKERFWTGIAGEIALIIDDLQRAANSEKWKNEPALKWADLAAGLLEFAFRKYVKGKF